MEKHRSALSLLHSKDEDSMVLTMKVVECEDAANLAIASAAAAASDQKIRYICVSSGKKKAKLHKLKEDKGIMHTLKTWNLDEVKTMEPLKPEILHQLKKPYVWHPSSVWTDSIRDYCLDQRLCGAALPVDVDNNEAMPRPNNKRNKYQKQIFQSRANPAAAAATPVRTTHSAHAVDTTVREAALSKPMSTQAVDASPPRVVLSQPSISVSDAECQVPQPPESLDNSASIAATTKRCVRTVVYNTWSGYCHVPRHLTEPLRFETNVKQVAAEGRRLVCFFAEAEEPPLNLPAENITCAVDARKEDKVEPQELNQNSKSTTLIASGSDVCGKAQDGKIVTQVDENHPHDELLPNPVVPPPDLAQQEQYAQSTTGQEKLCWIEKGLQVGEPVAKVDDTRAASTASLETKNCAKILTTQYEGHTHWELPKPIASLQDPAKQENAPVNSTGSAADLKPLIVKIVTTSKINGPKELSNCSTARKGPTKENLSTATSFGLDVKLQANNLTISANVCGSQTPEKLLEFQEQSSTLMSVCFITSPKPQIAPSSKGNALEQEQTGSLSPTASQKEKSKYSKTTLPISRNKIHQSIPVIVCETNMTIGMTDKIAPIHHVTEQTRRKLVLGDSAVDLRTSDINDSAPKRKPNKATKSQSRGQRRATLAKAAKVRQT
ncbi:hypothetical protein HDU78_009671 [Chytriomyces hyalinus]|nr:hypothetical protein HDU78_009671 [Chytriomyces hyalinus]